MAYLTAKEIKQLKPITLDAKLIYLFTLKPRTVADGIASATEEETREQAWDSHKLPTQPLRYWGQVIEVVF